MWPHWIRIESHMRSIEWLYCRWPWVTPKHVITNSISTFCNCLMHLRNWWSQRIQIWYKGWMCKSQPTADKLSLIVAWSCRSCDPLQNFWGSNNITETAELKVVDTSIDYINSNSRMTYHQQKGRGYGHVTALKFCRLSWSSASRGFVLDSWASCLIRMWLSVSEEDELSHSAWLWLASFS